MRKREIQSFTLKIGDLKEYEVIRDERANAKKQLNESNAAETSKDQLNAPLFKTGPKSKQEIKERLGMSME